ncbi:MAG: LPS assembly lipoprotein LptE [Pseudomonadota bacterium]
MWLSDRRKFLAACLSLPLAGCGFQPVYGPSGAGLSLRNKVTVEPPTTRLGFEFVARVEERFGRPQAAFYDLSYAIETQSEGIAIAADNDTTRVRVIGDITYALTEVATNAQVLAGSVSSFTAYSTTGSTLATDSARRDAENRLMIILADRLVDEVISGAARFA